jgi:hypothetical protein
VSRIIHGKNAQLFVYAPAKETVTGLVIESEPIEIECSSMDICFTADRTGEFASLVESLPDASGEFTGYFDK